MNMFEELKAWADRWGLSYEVREDEELAKIYFEGITYSDPFFSYNKNTGDYLWYGGD